jgi:hypothetical protein
MGPDTLDRVRRAVTLDATLYQEADQDESLTGEAILVAAVSGAVAGLLAWLIGNSGFFAFLSFALGAIVGLFIAAGILLLVGKLFGGQAEYQGLLRAMAYATAPNALSGIPFVGLLFSLWAFVCAVVAVRESHAVSTGIAVVILLIPAALLFMLALVLAFVAGVALLSVF